MLKRPVFFFQALFHVGGVPGFGLGVFPESSCANGGGNTKLDVTRNH